MKYSEEILAELLFMSTQKIKQGDTSLSQDIVTAIQIVENKKGEKNMWVVIYRATYTGNTYHKVFKSRSEAKQYMHEYIEEDGDGASFVGQLRALESTSTMTMIYH